MSDLTTSTQDKAEQVSPKSETVRSNEGIEAAEGAASSPVVNSPTLNESPDEKSGSVSGSDESEQLDTDSHETEQVVVFKLEEEEYAAPILEVQEIIPTGDITHFPNVPDYIEGIINVRGTVATVINISKRFNLSGKSDENAGRYIILTKSEKGFYGIMVDEVTSVMKIPVNKIKPASGISQSKINNEYVNNVAIIGDRVILILDFKKILDEEAISSAADQAQTAKV